MDRKQLINKYIEFFESKGHREVPNSSLVPENDPTVLFTTAGMHPLVPYLLGQKHPLGNRLTNVQKCVRTGDIEEVGDKVHHTFFEMLGNWSLGDYFKEEAIKMSFEFLTKVLGLEKEKIAASVFAGDNDAPKDRESAEIWKSLGIPEGRIAYLNKDENWWGPAGETGPCGPDTEMFYWSSDEQVPEEFDTEDDRWVEIWNDVFMEYIKNSEGEYEEAEQKNVDTGMGVERVVAVLQGVDDNYMASNFKPIIEKIEQVSAKAYGEGQKATEAMRIIADHIKTSVFILGERVKPSNTEHGYVLRRLIRRAVKYGKINLGIASQKFSKVIAESVFEIYDDYLNLSSNKETILEELEKEEEKFNKTLDSGLKVLKKELKNIKEGEVLTGKKAFLLYQSYGFPLEMIEEIAKEQGVGVDKEGFEKERENHKELSRTAAKGRFGAGLADNSHESRKLHTATHLLHQALREVLGKHVRQMGSNITPERLRFDFSHPEKLTQEQKEQVEELVNRKIEQGLDVSYEEMPYDEAVKQGALSFFNERYPDTVKVYSIGQGENLFSKEICTGPHVSNTAEISEDGRKFKIKKEESSSAGVRRIKAVLK
ncbi:MAG: alanine--tRNA ligase [Candidatus Pacearchaeota archaeon]